MRVSVVRSMPAAAREAEVQQPHRAVACDHDVVGFDVAVDDALRVRGRERVGQRGAECRSLGRRPGTAAADHQLEVLPVHELSHQVEAHGAVAPVQYAEHGRVPDARQDLDLALEAAHAVAVVAVERPKHLQRQGLPVRLVDDAEHLPHAATAEEREHAVAFAEDVPGLEVRRARRRPLALASHGRRSSRRRTWRWTISLAPHRAQGLPGSAFSKPQASQVRMAGSRRGCYQEPERV